MTESRFAYTQTFGVTDSPNHRAHHALATALRTVLAPLAEAGVTLYDPVLVPADLEGDDDELAEILGDAVLIDEVVDGDGHARIGQIRVTSTEIPERLTAWRDAAVRAALTEAGLDRQARLTAALNRPYPRYIVQSTPSGHYRIVAATPGQYDAAADGIDYTDFTVAKLAADAMHQAAADAERTRALESIARQAGLEPWLDDADPAYLLPNIKKTATAALH